MCIFRTITTPKRLHKTDDLTTFFEARFKKGKVDQVRQQRVGRNDYVATWHQNAKCVSSEFLEKHQQKRLICLIKHGEAGKWAAFMSIKCRRNTPNSAAITAPQLLLLVFRVFL
jgi:hypothetical protein